MTERSHRYSSSYMTVSAMCYLDMRTNRPTFRMFRRLRLVFATAASVAVDMLVDPPQT